MEKAKIVLEKMMSDRGYNKDDDVIYSSQEFEDCIKIFFCLDTKLNMDVMKSFVSDLQTNNIPHAIIVHGHVITSSTKKLIENLWNIQVETFHIDELQFNITEHCLYNKHEKVSLSGIMTKHFPSILKTDPVVRYFNFKRNDILRIYRKDGTIGYRIVR